MSLRQEVDRLSVTNRDLETKIPSLMQNITSLDKAVDERLNELNSRINQIKTLERLIN
jgi:hypothetical protein